MAAVTLEGLDLAALLCSRVCHDLISPVGAVVNGIEVMEDDADEQTKAFAIDLIKKSADYRLGAAAVLPHRVRGGRSAGAAIDLGDAEGVARGMLEDDKTKLDLELAAGAAAEKPGQAAAQSAVAGGRHHPARRQPRDRADRRGRHDGLQGHGVRTECPHPQAVPALVAGEAENPVDAHAIQPFFTGLLARTCGMSVTLAPEGEAIVLTAR